MYDHSFRLDEPEVLYVVNGDKPSIVTEFDLYIGDEILFGPTLDYELAQEAVKAVEIANQYKNILTECV